MPKSWTSVPMHGAAIEVGCTKVSERTTAACTRWVPEEVPVAFVYNGSTYAVMMASPSDMEDFAVGFSLTEGIVSTWDEIESLDVIRHDKGIELRMWLTQERERNLAKRLRRLAGPTGCGLCGIESLEAAVPSCPRVTAELAIARRDVAEALAALPAAQVLNQQTRAVHGAGFWDKRQGLVALAEDVGRHNALDKLIGRVRRSGGDLSGGIVLLTSRVSVEMVQKAASVGVPVIVAISAPTALALKTAEQAGITLIAVARANGFEIFTHSHRIPDPAPVAIEHKGMIGHAA